MDRRQFHLTSLLAGALAVSPLQKLLANHEGNHRNGIGLQLWTVRNQLSEDMKSTLDAIVGAGYQQIELMSVLGSTDIVAAAKDRGLQIKSSFMSWESICLPEKKDAPSTDAIIEKAKEFGLEHLVFGYIGKDARDTSDKIKSICDNTNKFAETAKAAGLSVSYHNHSFEFAELDNGKTAYDMMMERFDENVDFEVDVFWVQIGGWDVYDTMERLGKRMGQIHLKDLKAGVGTITDEGKVPVDAFEELGDGTIDMKRVLQIADKYEVKQFHVEQDQSPDPLASIKQSSEYLSGIWH